MYLSPSSNNKCDSSVAELQRMLNSIRANYHHGWDYLTEDGIYGKQTANVVRQFQIYRGISSQMTSDGPILGDTTIQYIKECYSTPLLQQVNDRLESPSNRKAIKHRITVGQVYSPVSSTVGVASRASDFYKPVDALSCLEKAIIQQANNLRRRISHIPKKARARHLLKAIEKSKEFIGKAKKLGVNKAATLTYGSLTKEEVIKYFTEAADAISNSKVTITLRKAANSLVKIKNALKPLYDFFNKIPGLKYLGAIEKIIKGTWSLFHFEFDTAFKYFLDAVREIVESILVDLAVVSLIAVGGWLAIVIALLLLVVVMIIDYFFFSDNAGNSLVDKCTPLSTRNVVQDNIAPWIYGKISQ